MGVGLLAVVRESDTKDGSCDGRLRYRGTRKYCDVYAE